MNRGFIIRLSLFFYFLFLFNVLVFKNIPLIRIDGMMFNFGGTQSGSPNYIPFKTILPYLTGRGGLLIAAINIIGNIVLLIPIGFLIPFVYRKVRVLGIFLFAVLFCLLIEAIQAFAKIGIFDIDDVILNCIGTMIGYWFFIIYPSVLDYFVNHKLVLILIGIFLLASIYYSILLIIPSKSLSRREKMNDLQIEKGISSNHNDLCNGTGGTGEILSIDGAAFTIQKRDGSREQIKLTNRTEIKTSRGRAASSILKPGVRVTIITSDGKDMIAELILICGS